VIQTEFWNVLDKVQTVQLTECLEWWHSPWADCMKSLGDCFEVNISG